MEIQLIHKTKKNIFCYCNLVVRAKKILMECQVVEYDSTTEENYNLEYKEFSLDEFSAFLKKDWEVC